MCIYPLPSANTRHRAKSQRELTKSGSIIVGLGFQPRGPKELKNHGFGVSKIIVLGVWELPGTAYQIRGTAYRTRGAQVQKKTATIELFPPGPGPHNWAFFTPK